MVQMPLSNNYLLLNKLNNNDLFNILNYILIYNK